MRRILFVGLAAIGVAVGCGQKPTGLDDGSQWNFGGSLPNIWTGGSADGGSGGYGSPDASGGGDDASPLGDGASGDDASPLGDGASDACADAAQDAAPPPPPDAASDACADAGVDAPADAPADAPPDAAKGCTLTVGFWKTHPTAWPVSSLTLGTVTYSESQLLDILEDPVNGNGLIALSYQLIAAKLNILNGADGSSIAGDISAADALIGSLVVPPIGSGYLSPTDTSTLTSELDSFNMGTTGPGSCD